MSPVALGPQSAALSTCTRHHAMHVTQKWAGASPGAALPAAQVAVSFLPEMPPCIHAQCTQRCPPLSYAQCAKQHVHGSTTSWTLEVLAPWRATARAHEVLLPWRAQYRDAAIKSRTANPACACGAPMVRRASARSAERSTCGRPVAALRRFRQATSVSRAAWYRSCAHLPATWL